MRFAYADPPYYGCAVKHYGDHPAAAVYDTIDGHRTLIDRLVADYPDGWALSMTSGNLHDLLPLIPQDCRIGAWVKPFVRYKMHVTRAYAWEPVIFHGGRARPRTEPTIRDWIAEPITMKRGLTGAKPEAVCRWIFDWLGAGPGDELVDLFPGSGAVGEAWRRWCAQSQLWCWREIAAAVVRQPPMPHPQPERRFLMGTTTDPNDPQLTHGPDPADGPYREQADTYLVLSDEERAKGFVRPVRRSYWHVTCGYITTMGQPIAETYARQPDFYGGTYCAHCGKHRPVGENGEFYWCDPDDPERQAPAQQHKVGT